MPTELPGGRHTAVATKQCEHGQIVVEDGFVGTAFKAEQVDRWTRPSAATTIIVDEEFEIQVGGIHEAPLAAGLINAEVGDKVWIDPSDNSLEVDELPAVNEVQTVTVAGSPTGGTFTLSFGGRTTGTIAFNAAAADVQAALEALSTIDVGDVTVTGSAGGPYTVTFHGGLQEQDVAQMTADGAALTGGSGRTVTIATQTGGASGRLPVGVISEIDTQRSTDAVLINSNAWQAFLPGA